MAIRFFNIIIARGSNSSILEFSMQENQYIIWTKINFFNVFYFNNIDFRIELDFISYEKNNYNKYIDASCGFNLSFPLETIQIILENSCNEIENSEEKKELIACLKHVIISEEFFKFIYKKLFETEGL